MSNFSLEVMEVPENCSSSWGWCRRSAHTKRSGGEGLKERRRGEVMRRRRKRDLGDFGEAGSGWRSVWMPLREEQKNLQEWDCHGVWFG